MSSKEAVLFFLRDGFGEFVSGEEISQRLSLSRTAVWKHIQNLKKEGYFIEALPKRGYRLIKLSDKLLPSEIRYKLSTALFNEKVYHFDEVGSTNDVARALANDGVPEGTLVIAEKQVKGKGRLGREWVSPSGGIWFTVILRPQISPFDALKITVVSGIAVAKAIRDKVGLEVKIKWPNDILIEGKKVAGILTEMNAEADKINFVVVGLGINVNFNTKAFPEELQDRITTLKDELGVEVDRVTLLKAILEKFERAYFGLKEGDFDRVMLDWKSICDTLGKRVRISSFGEEIVGEALDLDEHGGLVIKVSPGKMHTVYSGDVTQLRIEG